MNPTDISTQYEAMMNQAMQNQQQWMWGIIAIQTAFLLLGAWVLYMFYARLRDIAEELMKLRVAYEFANPPKPVTSRPSASVAPPENPPNSGDIRYRPE